MELYFLKTKHNQTKTDQLAEAIESLNLSFELIEEAFDPANDNLRRLGVQNIPCVIAVHENKLIKQTDNAYSLSTFEADSQAIVDALSEE